MQNMILKLRFIYRRIESLLKSCRYRYDSDTVKNIPISINAVSETQDKIQGNKYAEVYSIQKKLSGWQCWRDNSPIPDANGASL